LSFAPDGKRLVAGSGLTARLYEVATGRLLQILAGHDGLVLGVAFSPDGSAVATAGADRTVRLWDARTGKERGVWRGHTGRARCVAFHPNGRSVISGGEQPGDVKVWDLTRPPDCLAALGVYSGFAEGMAFDATGALLATVSRGGRLRIQDAV